MMGEDRLMTDRLQADLNSTDSISTASLSSGDLDIRLTTLCRSHQEAAVHTGRLSFFLQNQEWNIF